ncbi:MAG: hypothetical protein IMF09_08505 [Proteobacteria bacterium]|nr:hypothetical protein [Pseudomonadota bacterium]
MDHNLRPPQDLRNTEQSVGKNPNSRLWIFAGVIVVALLLVLLVLPKMVAGPVAKPILPAVVEQTPVVVQVPEPAIDNQTRKNAEQALQSFLRLQAQPELQNTEIWSADDWSAAQDTAADGDKAFGRENFTEAVNQYKLAKSQLQSILDDRDQILLEYLISGWRFLTDNALEDAREAFNLVLAMQADHQQAQLGLKQTAAREQVLELMQAGKQAEITDELQLAADAYTAALQLDLHYLAAEHGLKRVTLELEKRAFSDAMGLALQSLEQGEFSAADKALQQAAAISPDDLVLKETRQRLLTARKQLGLNRLRQQSQQLVIQEDWSGAAEKYRQAQAIDARAAFARTGLAQAEQRIKLHLQLDHYLTNPDRLFSNEPLENAGKLLDSNQNPPVAEPKLAGKLSRLEKAVQLAITPVDLLITSDSLTEVSIYKVGRQGMFAQKQLSLRPGKYTITGARKGYRDVLKVMDLKPAMRGQTISISSGEKF